jgi:hypothetical protein
MMPVGRLRISSWQSLLVDFVTDGYLVLPGFITGAEVRSALDIAERLGAEDQFVLGSHEPPLFLRNLAEHAPSTVLPLVADPGLLQLAEILIGPFVQLDSSVVAVFAPGTGVGPRRGAVEWHRDRHGRFPGGRYEIPTALVAIAYLQDMSDEMGPLRVIPGSHREPVAIPPDQLRSDQAGERRLRIAAGDLVLLHQNLLHSGGCNESGTPRRFLGFTYSHSALDQDDCFTGPYCEALRARAHKQGDRRMCRLLGQDETCDERVNTGFTQPLHLDWGRWFAADDTRNGEPIVGAVGTSRLWASLSDDAQALYGL